MSRPAETDAPRAGCACDPGDAALAEVVWIDGDATRRVTCALCGATRVLPREGAAAVSTARVSPYCTCMDHGVTGLDQLVELVNAGHDQWTASRALWSPISAEANALVVEVAGIRAAEYVRAELYARLPWLRPMPEPVEGVAA